MTSRKEKEPKPTLAKRTEEEIEIVDVEDVQEEGLLDEDDDTLPDLVADDGDEGDVDEGEEGEFDDEDEQGMEMYDPMQALGEIFVTEDGETIAEILGDIRDILDKGVKVIYKISTNMEKDKAAAVKKERK
jgi:hypothetical protein